MTKSKFIESLEAMFRAIGVELSDDASRPLVIDVPDESADAAFAFSEGDPLGGRKQWSGPLFIEGDYGPKGKYDAAKIAKIVENFPPEGVVVKDTHRRAEQEGFLDALMRADQTKVVRAWYEDTPRGRELHGTFDAPVWLDYAARNATKKVSIGLDPTGERLQEVSLVLRPHVAHAAVFSEREAAFAFAQSDAFAAAPEETRAAVLDLVPRAKEPAPALARTEGNHPPMTSAEKHQKGQSFLPPESRASAGLADPGLAPPLAFEAPAAPKDEPVRLAMARTAAKAEASRLRHAGFAFDEDDFVPLYIDACRADGGGAITFSEGGDLTTAEKVRKVVSLVENSRSVALRRETIGAQFGEGVSSGLDAYDKALGIKEKI